MDHEVNRQHEKLTDSIFLVEKIQIIDGRVVGSIPHEAEQGHEAEQAEQGHAEQGQSCGTAEQGQNSGTACGTGSCGTGCGTGSAEQGHVSIFNKWSEVIVGDKFWGTNPEDTSDPVLGQSFAYAYDNIPLRFLTIASAGQVGNRTASSRDSEEMIYTANNLNQYSQRTVADWEEMG